MSSPDEPPGGHEAPAWGAERYSPSSYAYKPPWAQPHYPLIPAQRTGPPEELGRPLAPPPAPPTPPPTWPARSRWLLAGLIALLVVALLAVVVAIVAVSSDRSPDSPATSPAAEAPAAPPAPVPSTRTAREAVAAWYRGGAQALLASVTRDLDAASAAADTADWPAMQLACRSLRTDVESAQSYGPSPDPEHAGHLSAALAEFARAATDCVSGTTDNDGELLSRAGAELSTASAELERATARLRVVNGN